MGRNAQVSSEQKRQMPTSPNAMIRKYSAGRTQTLEEILERTARFRYDRLGMFIHWGVYAIPGRGEWYRNEFRTSIGDYEPYVRAFNPRAFEPRKWARAAREAGMRYMVLTAKHHDGFCLFDSALTDYTSTHTAAGRDLVREYVEAVRAEGLQVGLYFSLIDWRHPDFPKYNDPFHPMRGQAAYQDEQIDFDRYLDYMHAQVKELVTGYGQIDILWFDFSYGDLRGEAWRADELIRMVRHYQPDVVIDNRLETSGGGFGSLVEDKISPYAGDFVSPEQILPYEGIRNTLGEAVPWELCLTMNNHWAYCPWDREYKDAAVLIRKLIECVSKGGNMILNVGPDAEGRFPREAESILAVFRDWMTRNGESIYGCGAAADLPKPEWGYYCEKLCDANGQKPVRRIVYAHLLEQMIGPVHLPGIRAEEVERMSFVHDGSEVRFANSWVTQGFKGESFVQFGPVDHFTYRLPDPVSSVIRIEFK